MRCDTRRNTELRKASKRSYIQEMRSTERRERTEPNRPNEPNWPDSARREQGRDDERLRKRVNRLATTRGHAEGSAEPSY